MTENAETVVKRYELADGVGSVRIGSWLVEGDGFVTDDPQAIELLDECEHVHGSVVPPKAEKSKAKSGGDA